MMLQENNRMGLLDLIFQPDKGQTDEETGQTYYIRDDGSNIVEGTRVKLTPAEKQEARSRGEVEVRRDRRTITLSNDGDAIQAEVIYLDND
jgi:hypothetical protein